MTESTSPAYLLGRTLSPLFFALVIFGIGYLTFLLIKRRKPNRREKLILAAIAMFVTLLSVVARTITT